MLRLSRNVYLWRLAFYEGHFISVLLLDHMQDDICLIISLNFVLSRLMFSYFLLPLYSLPFSLLNEQKLTVSAFVRSRILWVVLNCYFHRFLKLVMCRSLGLIWSYLSYLNGVGPNLAQCYAHSLDKLFWCLHVAFYALVWVNDWYLICWTQILTGHLFLYYFVVSWCILLNELWTI